MAYRPLSPRLSLPPHVERLKWKLERHYLAPAHALFRLPLPNYVVVGQFHFGIANLLLAAIAGISTTLYAHSGGNGERFRNLLESYYPFSQEPKNAAPGPVAAKTLWSVFRNSLAHDLGFDLEKRAKTPETKYLRRLTKRSRGERGLTERMIEELENHTRRPTNKATVEIRPDATVLYVDALYWGVRCMAEGILSDATRVRSAEAFLSKL